MGDFKAGVVLVLVVSVGISVKYLPLNNGCYVNTNTGVGVDTSVNTVVSVRIGVKSQIFKF
jgi:hypothetical protein